MALPKHTHKKICTVGQHWHENTMKTLLSVNNYFYPRGGAEVVFLEQNRILEQCGWTVVPFAMEHSKNLQSNWSRYFVEEVEFWESYSLCEKMKRIPRIVYSFEARNKLGK